MCVRCDISYRIKLSQLNKIDIRSLFPKDIDFIEINRIPKTKPISLKLEGFKIK